MLAAVSLSCLGCSQDGTGQATGGTGSPALKGDAAAGGDTSESRDSSGDTGAAGDGDTAGAALEGSIDEVGSLPGGDIIVPDYLQGDETASFSIISEGEGFTTYHLSSEERAKAAAQVTSQIQGSIGEVLSNKDCYPHITGISTNGDCSEFNVSVSGTGLTVYESALRMSLYIAGNRLQLYQGRDVPGLLTVVNYIDSGTGEVLSTGSSADMQ